MNRLYLPGFVLLLAVSASAQEGSRYEYRGRSSPHGTGKFYLGREIAGIARGSEWDPGQLARARGFFLSLGVRPGDAVADVGAGQGDTALLLADLVGATGRVYATEIDEVALRTIRRRAADRGLENVVAVRGAIDDPGLPTGALDLILVAHSYHEFSHPYEMTAGLVRALKPGGRLVLIEARRESAPTPYAAIHAMDRRQMLREMQPFPLRVQGVEHPALPSSHVFVFVKEATLAREDGESRRGALSIDPSARSTSGVDAAMARLEQMLDKLDRLTERSAVRTPSPPPGTERLGVDASLGRIQRKLDDLERMLDTRSARPEK